MICKYCSKEAVAIVNKEHPLCSDHVEKVQLEILQREGILGIAVHGKPLCLVIKRPLTNEEG